MKKYNGRMESVNRPEVCRAAVKKVVGGRRDLETLSRKFIEPAFDHIDAINPGRIEQLPKETISFIAETAAWFLMESGLFLTLKGSEQENPGLRVAEHLLSSCQVIKPS